MDYTADLEQIVNYVKDIVYSDASAYDIGRKTGVKHQNIYNLRNGKLKFDNITIDTLNKLTKYTK